MARPLKCLVYSQCKNLFPGEIAFQFSQKIKWLQKKEQLRYYLDKCPLIFFNVFGVQIKNPKSVFRGRHWKSDFFQFFPDFLNKTKWGTRARLYLSNQKKIRAVSTWSPIFFYKKRSKQVRIGQVHLQLYKYFLELIIINACKPSEYIFFIFRQPIQDTLNFLSDLGFNVN